MFVDRWSHCALLTGYTREEHLFYEIGIAIIVYMTSLFSFPLNMPHHISLNKKEKNISKDYINNIKLF